jgi:CheY-like chemotaxis protein
MPPALPAGRSNSSAARAGREAARARRVLLLCAAGCDALSAALSGAGFEAREARDAVAAARAVAKFAPHVVIVAARRGTGVDEFLQFARRLRAEEATRAVPLVVLCRRGDEETRAAALELGADDCFPLTTQPREALARVDALFWREEVGRGRAGLRAASDAAEREAQIDDSMRLLESAHRAVGAGERFSVALVAPAASESAGADTTAAADAGSDVESVKFAHDFLRLNLRRADSVAFYGPTLRVALLPRSWPRDARSDLARLLAELECARPASRLAAGFASFPGDGGDVETLIERADSELNSAIAPEEPREGATVMRREAAADEVAPAAEARTKFQPAADDERATFPQRPEPERLPPPPPRHDAPLSEGQRAAASEGRRPHTTASESARAVRRSPRAVRRRRRSAAAVARGPRAAVGLRVEARGARVQARRRVRGRRAALRGVGRRGGRRRARPLGR